MEEKRCLLCNKPYDYKYKMFGRGCLDNIYGILDFHKQPKMIYINYITIIKNLKKL